MIPSSAKQVVKRVAEYAALFAVFATVGSYWINTEVERRMGELLHCSRVQLRRPDPGRAELDVRRTEPLVVAPTSPA